MLSDDRVALFSMTAEQILEEVARLPKESRGDLAAEIIASLGQPDYDVTDAKVAERVRELESGEVQDISSDELRARMGR